ncbi:ATP-binding protein [Lysinibacillus xylanilyticus]|uniref:AAA family ATPase n=1 Tax=Lysinibacillus xylanilyticus TaxID=582475 RepID=UPI002B24D3FE|nr:AAA family ATPase [Lysinibacillus xylanilyticus]MEB2281021.1 ATP-binding protein [Lysinibacillus xylanilyticus]
MKKKFLLIIFGPCGAGKTSIAKGIASNYTFPLISRDTIKELLFDNIGWRDRDWCTKLGSTSYQLLYFFTDKLLETGSTFILESNQINFKILAKKINDLKDRHTYIPIIIRCFADKQILFERAIARDASGERHPGHVYPTNYEEYKKMLLEHDGEFNNEFSIEGLDFEFIDVDTTVFDNKVYELLYSKIDKIII